MIFIFIILLSFCYPNFKIKTQTSNLRRRKIWDLLQKKKKNHVTLLTTHSMDEADILADRKAVLSGGKVRCIGSSLFLKSKFGLGYHLNIMTSEKAAKSSTILDLIHRSVPDAQLTKQTGTALTCTLPLSSSQGTLPILLLHSRISFLN